MILVNVQPVRSGRYLHLKENPVGMNAGESAMDFVKPGQRFVTRHNRTSEWIVEGIVPRITPFPHVRMRRASDRTTRKLLALSVLTDRRYFRPVDTPDSRS